MTSALIESSTPAVGHPGAVEPRTRRGAAAGDPRALERLLERSLRHYAAWLAQHLLPARPAKAGRGTDVAGAVVTPGHDVEARIARAEALARRPAHAFAIFEALRDALAHDRPATRAAGSAGTGGLAASWTDDDYAVAQAACAVCSDELQSMLTLARAFGGAAPASEPAGAAAEIARIDRTFVQLAWLRAWLQQATRAADCLANRGTTPSAAWRALARDSLAPRAPWFDKIDDDIVAL